MKRGVFAATFLSALWGLWTRPVLAGQGCCSNHGGVAGCVGARLQCNDETLSPTCSCEGWNSASSPVREEKAAAVQIGKDILAKKDPKHPVHIEHLWPEIQDTFGTVVDAWRGRQLPTPVITSGNDGVHPGSNVEGTDCSTEALCRQTSDSGHYQNRAIDLRANNIQVTDALGLRDTLQSRLGDAYTVLFHGAHTDNAHFHIQCNRRLSGKKREVLAE